MKLSTPAIDERSAKVYKHWIKTFEAFLAVSIQPSATTSAGEDGEESSAPETPNKLALLINHVSPNIYSYFEDCDSYASAKKELDKVYLKKDLNDVYARHRLLTRRQLPGEDITQFSHSIKELAKDCDCRALTAEEFRAELARDAFITGLQSSNRRQRLLEAGLSFQSAVA